MSNLVQAMKPLTAGWILMPPRLRLQDTGGWQAFYGGCIFDKDVVYGDIVKGLPSDRTQLLDCLVPMFWSICLTMFLIALYNSFEILRPGGCLRLIVPDLKFFVESYTLENQQGAGNGLNDLPGFNFNLCRAWVQKA